MCGAHTTVYGHYAWNEEGGRLETLTTGSLQSLAYDYDWVGNILSITDILSGISQTQEFTYDALNRLVAAEAWGGIGGNYAEEAYVYRCNGNMVTCTVGKDTFYLSYNAKNRLLSASTTQSPARQNQASVSGRPFFSYVPEKT